MKKSELKARIKELEDKLFEALVEAAVYKRLYEGVDGPQPPPQQPWWPTTSPTTPVWQPDIVYTDKTTAPPFADWCKTTSLQDKVDRMNAWIESEVEKMHTEAEDTWNSFTTILRDKT